MASISETPGQVQLNTKFVTVSSHVAFTGVAGEEERDNE
jgi:hypothetical protein